MLMGVRTILFKIAFVLSIMLWATLIIFMIVLPFRWRHRLATGWGDTVIWLARWICGIRWQIHGREHVPQEAGVMVVNHQSTWETVFTPTMIRDQVWVLKKELMYVPFFGWGMALLRPIAIDRSKKKAAMEQVIDQGRQRIGMGFWVVMFPEGTRAKAGEPKPYKHGATRLAVNLGTHILPIVHNAGQFWPKKGRMHPGTVQVIIGEPIPTVGEDIVALSDRIEAWSHETMQALYQQELARRGTQ
ncbi:1-acyl-sn-glycerol-3-phosphate acyltransferase [Suttonella sp. R2A3]|uniref:lysophospholipid acyltransferase family protein n=1 Tax=Suttonella sp. R2A3 TaxID=2908648 RepID=UPI001F3BDF5D|nr:lysophospholipid acyltransferase family protein [Suttonella sp. R2A3]UJF23822.1 1-acyl-sn-glycerol-3-phosphate acyltransferase [Suttonella sp. R2A3]